MLGLGVAGLEVEHEITEPKDAAGPEDRGDALEGDRLPEVGKVVQRISREHEVSGLGVVVVREEPGLDDRDVVQTVPVDAPARQRSWPERCRPRSPGDTAARRQQ